MHFPSSGPILYLEESSTLSFENISNFVRKQTTVITQEALLFFYHPTFYPKRKYFNKPTRKLQFYILFCKKSTAILVAGRGGP
jgi:hypothetical protein